MRHCPPCTSTESIRAIAPTHPDVLPRRRRITRPRPTVARDESQARKTKTRKVAAVPPMTLRRSSPHELVRPAALNRTRSRYSRRRTRPASIAVLVRRSFTRWTWSNHRRLRPARRDPTSTLRQHRSAAIDSPATPSRASASSTILRSDPAAMPHIRISGPAALAVGDPTRPRVPVVSPADTIVIFDEPVEIQELGRTYMDRLGNRSGLFRSLRSFGEWAIFARIHMGRFGGVRPARPTHSASTCRASSDSRGQGPGRRRRVVYADGQRRCAHLL
jgi:hypothetical protein